MSQLQSLLEQQAALQQEIERLRRDEKAKAVAQVKAVMTEYGLTTADLEPGKSSKHGVASGTKVAPKYRDPETGNTWTGRGLMPKWLKARVDAGQKVEAFAI
jgi:DNA-binding protein H-NS